MNTPLFRSASKGSGGNAMGKLSQTDKHEPYVHTGQPNPEETGQQQNNPGQPSPVKKAVQSNEELEHKKKTGTR
jgi:hypothetical protein